MPRVAPLPLITSIDLYTVETNASTNPGAPAMTDDGRIFRYAKNGGSTLTRSNLLQATAVDTNFNGMAVQAAVAANATVIPVTLGASATTAGQFVGGIMVIDVTPGLGQNFTILAHDVAASGTCNFTVLEKVSVPLTTSSTASIVKNPYYQVVAAAGPVTAMAVGGAVSAPTSAQFCYVQTHGLGSALSDATATAASTMGLSPSAGTAGAVTKHVNQDQVVGTAINPVTIASKPSPIFWKID